MTKCRVNKKCLFIASVALTVITLRILHLEGPAWFPGKAFMRNAIDNADGRLAQELVKTSYLQQNTTTSSKVRILCLILTTTSGKSKMDAVNATWARRCDKHLFLFGYQDKGSTKSFPDVLHVTVTEGRHHLTGKVRRAFEHVYNTYIDTFDWILKADDDTYVIVENLRYLLSNIDPGRSGYLGFHMKPLVRNGYMSGGGGYVISSLALRAMVEHGFKKNGCRQDGGDEDVEIGKCLQQAGVPVLSSLGADGKETFHPEPLSVYLSPPTPAWVKNYAWNTFKNGSDCCSEYSISFHRVTHRDMYVYDHLLYRTTVFGKSKTSNGQ